MGPLPRYIAYQSRSYMQPELGARLLQLDDHGIYSDAASFVDPDLCAYVAAALNRDADG